METPVSIQMVPQQVLKDQQVIALPQAVQNVSGVQFTPTSGNSGNQNFVIRGFANGRNQLLRNGKRFPANRNMANVEQVEVLKGPASVLFGRLEPGGLVNVITKKPLDEPYYALQQQFGSYELFRTTVDATGPIDADKTLLYRFNLGYTDTESFRDELFNRTFFIAPALTWRPWDGAEVNLDYENRQQDNLFDSGIPVQFADGNNRIPPISRSSQFTEPGINDEQNNHLVDFNWSHRFNAFEADWTVRNGFQYQRNDFNFRSISADAVRADGRTVNRFIFIGPQNEDYYQVRRLG